MKRIEKIWSAALLLALTFSLLTAPGALRTACAQSDEGTPDLQKNWHLRVGLFVPQSQTTRGTTGEVGFSGIVERTVYQAPTYELNVGIGYNGWDTVYSVPITITGIAHHGNARYGAAVGYAFGKKVNGRGTSGAVLGLLVGYQLTRGATPLSADLRYNFITGSNSELDGYSLTIGTKF